MKLRTVDCGLRIAACLAMLVVAASALGQSDMTALPAGATSKPDYGTRYPAPITFGRSGKTVEVELLPGNLAFGTLVLRAYGRAWTEPSKDSKFTVPAVRVPTVFSITPADKPESVLGQLVAYPDRNVEWDKKTTLYALGAPAWFNQWAAATGLPVKQIKPADFASTTLVHENPKVKSLLIIGDGSAGKDLSDVAKLAKDKGVNVLVLDACWFGESSPAVSIEPKHMLAGLTEVAKQRWPASLKFASRRQPWGGIANRWAWIVDDDGLPLVEELTVYSAPWNAVRPVLASYVPWSEQLGRNELADATIEHLLVKAAHASVTEMEMREINLVYPKQDKLDKKDRPVLWAAANTPVVWKDLPGSVWIVDFRGKDRLPDNLLDLLRANEKQIGDDADRLLILGDDKMLDEWKWLKLDRAKKAIKRAGVVWLSDDGLPPSKTQQIKLMLKLTELGVPLAPPHEQEMGK